MEVQTCFAFVRRSRCSDAECRMVVVEDHNDELQFLDIARNGGSCI